VIAVCRYTLSRAKAWGYYASLPRNVSPPLSSPLFACAQLHHPFPSLVFLVVLNNPFFVTQSLSAKPRRTPTPHGHPFPLLSARVSPPSLAAETFACPFLPNPPLTGYRAHSGGYDPYGLFRRSFFSADPLLGAARCAVVSFVVEARLALPFPWP